MNQPFPFYGSKSNLSKWIIGFFPENYDKLHYVEPFSGSLAVLFTKTASKVESISDLDDRIYNFYQCLKDKRYFNKLEISMDASIYHEKEFRRALKIVKGEKANKVDRAWALWLVLNQCVSGVIDHPAWAYARGTSVGSPRYISFQNRKDLMRKFHERFKKVQIFNRDAIEIIKKTDSKEALFYLDPPYVGHDKGYSKKYTKQDFMSLLRLLRKIKGKFLLSCYQESWMRMPKAWKIQRKEKFIVSNVGKKQRRKVEEVLIMNYDIESQQIPLFLA